MRNNRGLGNLSPSGFPRIMAVLLTLTCWRACEGQLASNAVWPCYGADAQHTRRSRFLGPQNDSVVELWAQYLNAELSSPVVDANGNIYIGSDPFQVISFDAGGRLRWTYTGVGIGVASTPVLDADGTVYVPSSSFVLYAIDGNTGNLKWSRQLFGFLYIPALIGHDNTLIVPTTDGYVYTLRGDTGAQNWMLSMGESVWSSPAIGYDGTVYISTSSHLSSLSSVERVYALDYTTGATIWVTTIPSYSLNSPTISGDGYLYVGSEYMVKLSGTDGNQMFAYNAGSTVRGTAGLSPSDDMVYFVANENLLALSSTGLFKWSAVTGIGLSDPFAIGADGTVYAGSDNSVTSVFAYDGYTGAVKWQYQLTSLVNTGSLVIAGDGVLLLGSNSAYHAIGTPRTYPSTSPSVSPSVTPTYSESSSTSYSSSSSPQASVTPSSSPSESGNLPVGSSNAGGVVGGAVGGAVGGVAALVVVVGVIVFVKRGKTAKRTQVSNSSIVHTNSNIILTKQTPPLSPSGVNGVNFGQQQEVYSPGYMNAPTAPAGDDNNPTTKLDVKSGYDNGNESKGDGTSSSYGGYPHTTTTATVQYLFEMPPPPTFVEGDAHTPYGYPNPVDSLL